MYFWNYGLSKTSLDKEQKSNALERPWTSNILNRLKKIWNVNDGTFTMFIDHCERN